METVKIIGMGMGLGDLPTAQLEIIERADILVGGQRHLEQFDNLKAQKRRITGDLDGLIQFIQTEQSAKRIVVLASGDPLFYGIGKRLIEALGSDRVDVYANITSVAAAFARIKEPWHDAVVISAHGRSTASELIKALQDGQKIAVLTDPRNSPAWLAEICLKNGITDYNMCVFERLGSADERIGWYTLPVAAQKDFGDPNLVVLKRIRRKSGHTGNSALHLGMPDIVFDHEAGLITKAEVRAVSISKLRLAVGNILWDLGAGSGSVAIEASLFIGKGQMIAVEKNPNRVRDIQTNASRFNLTNLQVVQAEMPDGLAELPAPDRVFIGGGGKQLARIIEAAAGYLNPKGIIVANTVLLESLHAATQMFEKLGFETEVTQIQINRSRSMPWGRRLEAENPVWIVAAERKSN